jgi:hypothetical protein
MNFPVTISKPFRTIISEETLNYFLYLHDYIIQKQDYYLTHVWEYIFPHFTLRTQARFFISMLLKTQATLACVRSLSLGSHITFDSL